jgi:co-chaperonin GroES (HSP10)
MIQPDYGYALVRDIKKNKIGEVFIAGDEKKENGVKAELICVRRIDSVDCRSLEDSLRILKSEEAEQAVGELARAIIIYKKYADFSIPGEDEDLKIIDVKDIIAYVNEE